MQKGIIVMEFMTVYHLLFLKFVINKSKYVNKLINIKYFYLILENNTK